MEKQGKVSLWVGSFNSREDLDDFIGEVYDDEGDVSSVFIDVFKLDYVDSQFQEVYFYEDKSNKEEIFDGFSYVESFINSIPEINWSQKNTVLLLYNFEYSKKNSHEKMEFIGAYDFVED